MTPSDSKDNLLAMSVQHVQAPSRPVIEICVQSADAVSITREAGADRAELARELHCGGLTPSDEEVLAALAVAPPGGLRILVRDNPDSFEVSDNDVRVLADQVRHLAALVSGAEVPVGFVIGGLRGARISAADAALWRQAAPANAMVFHRAFDLVEDQAQALELLIDLGYDAVLTTGGGEQEASEAGLASLVRQGGSRITIIGSGGLREHNISRIVENARLAEVHFRAPVSGSEETDEKLAARMIQAIRQR